MIDFSDFKKVTIGGVELKQLFFNGIQVWKSGYKNWVPCSTEADGATIYNGGLGYKNGYRVRSGGAETTNNNSSITGYIPVKGGDVVRISGCDFGNGEGNGSALNVSDSGFTNIGQFTMLPANYGIFAGAYSSYNYTSVAEESSGIWKWTVPPAASGVAYIRITGNTGGDGSKMIVTINETLT